MTTKPKPMILLEASEWLARSKYEVRRSGGEYMVSKDMGGFMASNLIIEWMTGDELIDMAKCLGYKGDK